MPHRRSFGTIGSVGLALVCLACSGSNGTPGNGTGGATLTGSVGGAVSTGGSATTGGSKQTGGSSLIESSRSAGGNVAAAGGNSTGSSSTASSSSTGGTSSLGGTRAAGGVAPTTGGASVATGGTSVGGKASAGASMTGGTKAVGGTSTRGGTSNGGTSNGGANVAGATSTDAVKSPGCGKTTVPAACSTSGSPCTVAINSKDRTYYVVLPANYNPNTAYPIVTTWPYYGGKAEDFLPTTGTSFGGIGNFYGMRTGFPNAIYTTAQGLAATAGGTDYVWNNNKGEDVALAKAMVTAIEGDFCVDQSRIFAMGMSYGGVMSTFLGCQAPDVFRALGIIAGGMYGSTASCLNHPIAAWFTHGDVDDTVPIANGIAARDLFLKANGCNLTDTQTLVLDSNTTCTIYNQCSAGSYPVVFCPVLGGTHTIPKFSAGEITKFFMQF